MSLLVALLLLALWLLAWGGISVANVLSGIAVILLLLLAFPAARRRGPRARLHPIGVVRLIGYLLGQIVASNILVAREILSPRSHVQTGIVGYRVEQPSDLTLTLMANILALAPGMMTADVTRDPPTIYVHCLLLSDIDDARRAIAKLESMVVGAVSSPTDSARSRRDGDER